jgi:hypothetical protein
MRSTICAAVVLAVSANFVLGFVVVSALLPDGPQQGVTIGQAEYGERWPFAVPEGRLRCEGAGAVIFTVHGKDYAVNGMAASRYASIQGVWKSTNDPDIDAGVIISKGLTLCNW